MDTKEVHSPRGRAVTLAYREGTSDLATIASTFNLWGDQNDEYGLAGIRSDGLMVDVGAHIGSVCIAFLIDNPDARAVAIEPLPENVAMIRDNARRAGVADRLTVLWAAIGTDTVRYGHDDHEFIGNIGGANGRPIAVARTTLSGLGEPIDVLKIDCEGCEWAALSDPAVPSIRLIVGEWHTAPVSRLYQALGASHDIEIVSDTGDFGTFRAARR